MLCLAARSKPRAGSLLALAALAWGLGAVWGNSASRAASCSSESIPAVTSSSHSTVVT